MAHIGSSFKKRGFSPLYPVVIIPGLCSSSLEVKESTDPNWINHKIWISLPTLASTILEREKSPQNPSWAQDMESYIKNHKWISHIIMQEDGFSDPPSIKVRAVEGLKGCTYLSDEPILHKLSYVFGPIAECLQEIGYNDSNLKAATYDWRIPPSKLEERDRYFSRLQEMIELMVRDNSAKVVIVAHSLGNRLFQYFLRWIEKRKGREWASANIQNWIAVGPLWLGAPKSIRGAISGERMTLDFFLIQQDGICLARRMGSLPLMLPFHTRDTNVNDFVYLSGSTPLDIETAFHVAGCEKVWLFFNEHYLVNAKP